MKKEMKMDKWLHMSKTSVEYEIYKHLSGKFEADAYACSGIIAALHDTELITKDSIKHWERARIIYNFVDMKSEAKQVDFKIAGAKAILLQLNGNSCDATGSAGLESAKSHYENISDVHGSNSEFTIGAGVYFAKQLKLVHHSIEAEWLAMTLATLSRRVHGSEHDVTKLAEEVLGKCKVRYVFVIP